MQIGRQLVDIAVRLDQRIRELQRVRGGVADASDGLDLRDGADQQSQIRGFVAAVDGATVGIDVLAKQVDLAHALLRQLHDFKQHIVERS